MATRHDPAASVSLLTRGDVAKRLGIATSLVRELDHWYLAPVVTSQGGRYRRGDVEKILTRKVVARRLGKSVAAIRAIEGALLHPSEGPNGVRLFDADEVDRLAGRPLGVNAHSQWFRMQLNAPRSGRHAGRSSEVERLRRQVAALSDENQELRAAITEFIGARGDAID